jgi:hypothetical protein
MSKSPLISAPHERQPWGHAGDDRVIVHCQLSLLNGTLQMRKEELDWSKRQKQLYDKAKYYNDHDAAAELVERCVDEKKITAIAELVARSVTRPIIVFPHPSFDDEAADGHLPVEKGKVTNAIPFVFGAYLAETVDADIETNVVQAARVGRTQLKEFTRFLWQPRFDGPIVPRRPYIIVDDVFTVGGTLAALRCHIIRSGGTVLCCSTLAHGSGKDQNFAVARASLDVLEELFGPGLGQYWKDTIGHEIHCLTDGEAVRLTKWGEKQAGNPDERLHALRERFAQAAATGE